MTGAGFVQFLKDRRKLIVAVVGLGIIVLKDAAKIEVPWASDVVVDGFISLVTAIFVHQVPNG